MNDHSRRGQFGMRPIKPMRTDAPMTATERAHKIDMIGALPRDELKGWWLYVVTRELRPLFDGERAALLTRARVLGISLEG